MKPFLTQFFTRTILVLFSIFLLSGTLVKSQAQGCTAPQVFNVTGGCPDEPINLSGSETGVTYHLITYNGIDNVDVAQLQGTGLTLSFDHPFVTGQTYFIVATNDCSPPGGVSMNGMIIIGPHVQVFNVTGGCTNNPIALSGSQVNVTYHLMTYDGFDNVDVSQLPGTGSALSFDPPFVTGQSYFIIATNDCSPPGGVSMSGIIIVGPHVQIFDVTGGCSDEAINLSGSETGVTYHLWTLDLLGNNVQVGELQGTGGVLSFNPPFNAGRPYFVVAINSCSPFGVSMNGNIIVRNPPQVFNVSGGCPGSPINLSGSEIGVTYHLFAAGDFNQVAELQGTGGPLSFDPPPGGSYYVIATNSCKPLGVSVNGTVSIGFQTFFLDADGDGYGNPDITTQSCPQPGGYVSNNTDCNDNNNNINPATQWVLDADTDGFYIGEIITQCASPGTGYVRFYYTIIVIFGFTFELPNEVSGDCDDKDPTMHSEYPFYPDDDGDGYGNFRNLVTQMVCAVDANTPPSGYSLNNSDCNDDDPAVWQSSGVVYIDNDGDGYDNGQVIICIGATLPAAYSLTTNGSDCDDANDKIYPGVPEICDGLDNDCDELIDEEASTFYLDNDGDGLGAGIPVQACSALPNYVTNNDDCDDTDPNLRGEFPFWQDGDGDGFGAGAKGFRLCALDANTPPEGYSTNNSDCDDANDKIYPGAPEICDGLDNDCDEIIDEEASTFYLDNDGDGLGAGIPIQACTALPHYVTNNDDCDDTDANLRGEFPFWRDLDGDGFGAGTKGFALCALDANTPPDGYSTNNSDCDDANDKIYPGAPEICDGLDNDCDELIDEEASTFYLDNDGDGLGAGIPIQACSALPNYVTNNDDCDDTDPNLRGEFSYWPDGDGDGFGVGAKGFRLCALDANTPPEGYSTNNSDCDDANDKIYPAAPEICNGIDDNCNGVVDEQACICQNATNLSTTNITCNSATLNWVAYINPTQWELEYKSNTNGSKWMNVPVPNASTRSVTITGLKSNQNYQWHIRAKCGKPWTPYSGLVLFRTLPTCTTSADLTRSTSTAKPEGEISGKSVSASPNPSNTNFRITLSSNNLKEPVQLIITDMLGRVIETRTTTAGQIIIGERYRSGTYVVSIIQGKEKRQLKLIKLP